MRKHMAVLSILALVACGGGDLEEGQDASTVPMEDTAAAPSAGDDHGEHAAVELTPEWAAAVEQVREATRRFQDLSVARAEGWVDQYPEGCAQSEAGAQAYHWLNPSLVDGRVELLQPELFMYEPQEDGSMELVGVDYIIPFDQWNASQPPMLQGQALLRNEPLGVWALHIWAWRDNPSGMFAPWNPNVSCEFAAG